MWCRVRRWCTAQTQTSRCCCSPPTKRAPSSTRWAWRVDDLEAEVAELRERGVRFEEYDDADVHTDDGIAVTPVGRAAWFKDSEGNVLTISQLN
jgi:hypothetical protein